MARKKAETIPEPVAYVSPEIRRAEAGEQVVFPIPQHEQGIEPEEH